MQTTTVRLLVQVRRWKSRVVYARAVGFFGFLILEEGTVVGEAGEEAEQKTDGNSQEGEPGRFLREAH